MRIGIFPNLIKRESAAIVQQMIKICENMALNITCQPTSARAASRRISASALNTCGRA